MADKKEEFDLVVLGDKMSQVVESYWKPFLGFVVVGVAISGVSVAMKKSAANEEKIAFEKLYGITEIYEEKKKDFEEAEAPKPPEESKELDKEAEPEKKLVKASGDLATDYGEIPQKLEAFISAHPMKQAAGEAALTLASIYQEYEQNQKAADVVMGALKGWPEKDLMFSLLNMKAGNIWSALGDCSKALSHWTLLTQTESFAKDEAILKVGLCHQKLGQNNEAKVWFQKISSRVPETPSATSAKKFLRFLQFQDKLPGNAQDKSMESKDPQKDSES